MSEQHEPAPPSMGSPDESLGGRDIDEAVANAEAGSQVDGVHTPSGKAESGESRLEQMVEVDTDRAGDGLTGDSASAAATVKPGPGPGSVGAGGAQRVVGARVSDRVAAGEPVPEGPPFDGEGAGQA